MSGIRRIVCDTLQIRANNTIDGPQPGRQILSSSTAVANLIPGSISGFLIPGVSIAPAATYDLVYTGANSLPKFSNISNAQENSVYLQAGTATGKSIRFITPGNNSSLTVNGYSVVSIAATGTSAATSTVTGFTVPSISVLETVGFTLNGTPTALTTKAYSIPVNTFSSGGTLYWNTNFPVSAQWLDNDGSTDRYIDFLFRNDNCNLPVNISTVLQLVYT